MIGPVSHPGPERHSSPCPEFSGSDGRISVVLSCCAPYRRYGIWLSTYTWYISAVGWLYCVLQVRPPLTETLAPPSLACTMRLASRGLIQMSWLSPCGVGNDLNVLPASVDLKKPSAPAYTTSALVGSAV